MFHRQVTHFLVTVMARITYHYQICVFVIACGGVRVFVCVSEGDKKRKGSLSEFNNLRCAASPLVSVVTLWRALCLVEKSREVAASRGFSQVCHQFLLWIVGPQW